MVAHLFVRRPTVRCGAADLCQLCSSKEEVSTALSAEWEAGDFPDCCLLCLGHCLWFHPPCNRWLGPSTTISGQTGLALGTVRLLLGRSRVPLPFGYSDDGRSPKTIEHVNLTVPSIVGLRFQRQGVLIGRAFASLACSRDAPRRERQPWVQKEPRRQPTWWFESRSSGLTRLPCSGSSALAAHVHLAAGCVDDVRVERGEVAAGRLDEEALGHTLLARSLPRRAERA